MTTNKPRVLFVLDSGEYARRERELREQVGDLCDPCFRYTDYENAFIRFLHGVRGVGNILAHLSYWATSLGSAIRLFAANTKAKPDVTVFINPIVGFFYCFLSAMTGREANVVLAGFLFVEKASATYLSLRKAFVRFSCARARTLIVYSTQEVAHYSAMFPSLASKFRFVQYGRDYDILGMRDHSWKGADYIASGGISGRDFQALADALNVLEERGVRPRCRIATRPPLHLTGRRPSGLDVTFGVRVDEFGTFLAKSSFVVIPLRSSLLSAGHMAMLEAMSQGKVIVITDLPAVRDYVGEDTVYFYPPGDPSALAGVIEFLLQHRSDAAVVAKGTNARERYRGMFRFESLLRRIVVIATSP